MKRVLVAAMIVCAGAAQASPDDDYRLGRRDYFAGDMAGASLHLQRAADQGHAPAQALYGRLLRQTDSPGQALSYLRKAAAQDNREAQFELGSMYAAGDGVARDPAEARRWLEMAARGGYRPAIVVVADAYANGGLGLEAGSRNGPDALAWLRLAAEQDHPGALDRLAQAYRRGEFGLAADPQQAAALEARSRALRGLKPAAGGR